MIYAEIGFGNESFLSTEIEQEDGSEYRIPKFIIPKKIYDLYLRIWFGYKVYILSTTDGIKYKIKDKRKIKILFGISGN